MWKKSLCKAVTIGATLVNIHIPTQTDRHFDQLIRIARPAGLKTVADFNKEMHRYLAKRQNVRNDLN